MHNAGSRKKVTCASKVILRGQKCRKWESFLTNEKLDHKMQPQF